MPYSGARVSATRVTSDGTVLDPAGIVLFTGDPAADITVASAGGDYLVTWVDRASEVHDNGHTHPDRLCATRLRASDGARLDGAAGSCGLALEDGLSSYLQEVGVTSDGNRYLVAWMQNSGSSGWAAQGALVDPGTGPFDAGTGALSFTLVPFTETLGEHLKTTVLSRPRCSIPNG